MGLVNLMIRLIFLLNYHKLTQVSKIRKAFANGSSANIKSSKTQLSKMIQLGGFLGRLLEPLLKPGLPLIGNVLKLLPKSVLLPLGLTAAASKTDAAIQKKIYGSGTTTVFLNEELSGITKIVEFLENAGLLIKGVSATVENEVKRRIFGYVGCYIGC